MLKNQMISNDNGEMLKILAAYGIPSRIVSVIGLMYEGTRAKVLSPDGESELF